MVSRFMGLEQKLGYTFVEPKWLQQALTHRSFSSQHNERLEFLGDSILSWVITRYLYDHFPKATEGELTRMRASLVNGRQLGTIADAFQLQHDIQVGVGEKKGGTFLRESILADAVEALLGAIFLDSDLPTVEQVILRWWQEALQGVSPKTVKKDPKTQLQEWMQARGYPLPVYEVVKIEGPAHEQMFSIRAKVAILSQNFEAKAASKRLAEQQVAELVLKVLSERE